MARPKEAYQGYAHFGLERAILGVGAGLVSKEEHLRLMRLISINFPGLLPQKLLEDCFSNAASSGRVSCWVTGVMERVQQTCYRLS